MSDRFLYTIHLADNALILGQRNAEWTGHGPVLEQDIAITNISLDLLGQARNFYQYAATLYKNFSEKEKAAADRYVPALWKAYNRELQEDDLAFLRDEHQFLNLLITELPRGDWAQTVLRQFFFSVYQFYLYGEMVNSQDPQLAAIAEKSLKEVAYHMKWSAEWVIRLGDGTPESFQRIKNALADQWMFTGEMFTASSYEQKALAEGFGIDVAAMRENWLKKVEEVFTEAGLPSVTEGASTTKWTQTGGKEGRHTEYMGYLLAEMQHLQRAYPNATW
ncbi:MAG TPA: 1,2-phenylacetyl-CoA epoxidase subunit PaaC [Chitinophagaceae bacterium]|nr:1,2-phenylacetyl-CoA epoxidase subunit PaaC [Chitinophagaceae bacterium]